MAGFPWPREKAWMVVSVPFVVSPKQRSGSPKLFPEILGPLGQQLVQGSGLQCSEEHQAVPSSAQGAEKPHPQLAVEELGGLWCWRMNWGLGRPGMHLRGNGQALPGSAQR